MVHDWIKCDQRNGFSQFLNISCWNGNFFDGDRHFAALHKCANKNLLSLNDDCKRIAKQERVYEALQYGVTICKVNL